MLLQRAIRSVLAQRCACDEIIIVDDGSHDGTDSIVEEVTQKSGFNITYIKQENQGPAAARNRGVSDAKNEVIAFLDSDDHWYRDKLKHQYPALVNSDDYLVSHTKEKWLRRGEHLNQKKKHVPRDGYIFDHCLQLCAVGMSTAMVKKELFNKVGYFDESLPCCEDYDFWLRVSNNFPFLLIDKPLTVKEGGREDQVSYTYRVGMDQFRIRSMEKLLSTGVLNEKNHLRCLKEFCKKTKIYGKGCIKHGKQELGTTYLAKIKEQCEIASLRFPKRKSDIYGSE